MSYKQQGAPGRFCPVLAGLISCNLFKRRKPRQGTQERNLMNAGIRDHGKTPSHRGTCSLHSHPQMGTAGGEAMSVFKEHIFPLVMKAVCLGSPRQEGEIWHTVHSLLIRSRIHTSNIHGIPTMCWVFCLAGGRVIMMKNV